MSRPPCPGARLLPLEAFPGRRPIVCARCGAGLREGEGPAEEAWCPGSPPGDDPGDRTLDDSGAHDASPPSIGRWRLERVLGVGGAGVVYRAWDTVLERPVALKLLAAGRWAAPATLARFRREAKAAGQLGLPGVVRVLDMGTAPDGAPWIAMELVEGPSLAAVRADGPLAARPAARLCAAVARTLAAVHAAGLAHRDVKPGNIVLDPRGNPVLVDFGLVVPLDAGETRGQVGTPAYMAPEQLGDAADVDWRRVDIYALGRVLAHLCPEPPPDLAAVAARATASLPEDRYPDAGALAEDLEAFLAGRAPSAAREGWLLQARRFARRHRTMLTRLAAALGLLAVAAAGVRVAQVRARRAAQEAHEAELASRLALLLPEMERLDRSGGDGSTLLASLLEDPANVHTAARALAWEARARQLTDAGRMDDAKEAWARGILLARRPKDRAAGLVGLAETLASTRDWAALSRTLAQLDPASSDTGLAALRIQLALATGDLTGAGRLDPPDAAFLANWSTATRVAQGWDGAFIALGPDAKVGYLERADGAVFALDADGIRALPSAGDCAPDAVFSRRHVGEAVHLVALRPDGVADCGPLPFYADPVRVEDELYFPVGGYTRRLFARAVKGGPMRVADPDTDALGSFAMDVRFSDVDGDGTKELIVATGPSRGYGVRIFRHHAADASGRTLTLLAHTLFGMPLEVMPLAPGWLVAGTTTERPNRYLFGAEQPNGVPPGLHLLRLDAGRLDVARSWPSPSAERASPTNIVASWPKWAGDADGDGQPDVVANHTEGGRAALGLHRGAPGPDLRGWFVEGWSVQGALQLDDDPAPELVARPADPALAPPGDLYVLGLGETPLPRLALPPEEAVPADGPPELLFARLGLHDVAARALERAAQVAPGDRRSGLFALAAEEWRRCGRHADAAAAWDAARDEGEAAGKAREEWLAAGDFDAALAEPGGVGTLAEADSIATLAGPGTAVALTPPHGAWRLTLGLARPNLHAAALDLQSVSGAGTVARLPLRRTGEGMRLRATLHLERVEWDAGFEIQLRPASSGPPDPPGWPFWVNAGGGGGVLVRHAQGTDCGDAREVAGAAGAETLTWDLAISPARTWFAVARDGVEVARCTTASPGLGGEDWELVIRPSDEAFHGLLARGALTELTLWGLAPRDDGSPPPSMPPIALVRTEPGAPELWHDARAGFRAFRDVWEAPATNHVGDAEIAAGLVQVPDPTPWIRESADARWALVLQGQAAWAAGEPGRARRALETVLPRLGRDEWELTLAAHATLAEIAVAEGDRTRAAEERRRAIAAAPTVEVGELSLRRYPRLAGVE